MTIASEVNRSGPYNGNGLTTAFAYQFKIYDPLHLQVIKTDPNGTETVLVYQTDYSVTGVGNDGGGSAVLLVAPPAGYRITLLLKVPFTQDTDLENQGAYYAETVERAFDLNVMRLQQLKERSDRAVTIPASADASALDELLSFILTLGDHVTALELVASVSQYLEDVAAVSDDIPNVAGLTTTTVTKAAEALTSANNATASATLAGQYANNAEDVVIPGHPGEYSGLHFRNKCQAIYNALTNTLAGWIHAATSKTYLNFADADELGIADSAAAWGLKKISFLDLKAWGRRFFGADYLKDLITVRTSATRITIGVGEIRGNGYFVKNLANIAKDINTTWVAGNNVGGMESGRPAVAANLTYHLHALMKLSDGSFEAMYSDLVIPSNIPSGYVWVGRFWSVYTLTGPSIVNYTQIGNVFGWGGVVWFSTATSITGGIATLPVTNPCPSGIPVKMYLYASVLINGTSSMGLDVGNAHPGGACLGMHVTAGIGGVTASQQVGAAGLAITNTSRQLYVGCSVAGSGSIDVSTSSWEDFTLPRVY
jgi:hypothetical protein